MGPSQFDSSVGIGTSDAMQCYLRWAEHAHSLGHFVTVISADVEGGFDKGDPARLSQTHLDPPYAHWIRHWASNRTLQFRPNHRPDPRNYIINDGFPQGSPWSPFLFGAYIKSIMNPGRITTPSSTRLVSSCVDDVLICISADSRQAIESRTRSTWDALNDDANRIGMSFAEHKTKTLHDRLETWGIGSTVNQLRFLGYWLEKPPPHQRTHHPSYSHHLHYWTTEANYTFNMLRALPLRSDRGVRSSASLRILDACLRSILLYGVEFWRSDPATPRKTLLDAEATALVCGLDAALALPQRGGIFLISDCPAALRIFQVGPAPGSLNYLMSPMGKLVEWTSPILAAWIKGHSGHPGNDRADALAKSASLAADPFPGSSHSYLALHLTTPPPPSG